MKKQFLLKKVQIATIDATRRTKAQFKQKKCKESSELTRDEYNTLEWRGLSSIKEICNELEGVFIEESKCSVRKADRGGETTAEITTGLMLNIKRKNGTRAVFCFTSDDNNNYPCYASVAER